MQRLGVAEVANVCMPGGCRYASWPEFSKAVPEAKRHGASAQRQFKSLVMALESAGIPPAPGRTPVPASKAMSGMEGGVATTSGAAERLRRENEQASGDGGVALLAALDARVGGEDSADYDRACAQLKGTAQVQPAIRTELVGPDQLAVDGAGLRTVYSYNRKIPPGQRIWRTCSTGGKHSGLATPPVQAAAWKARVLRSFFIGADGWLSGDQADTTAPKAALFWWACEERLRRVERKPNPEECKFAFEQLIEIEATYPVTHFVATDGSRQPQTEEDPLRVGRVAVMHDGQHLNIHGGAMEVEEDGFQKHSFEAEMAGFSDALWWAPEGSVVVVVTDCLSGGLAGARWRVRSASDKSGRYRDKALADIERLEARHRAVLYVWVHSHIGITPNEVADAECDALVDHPCAEVLRMPSRHQLASLPGIKRSVGGHAYQHALAMTTDFLYKSTKHTLHSEGCTWSFFRDAPSMRGRILRQTDHDELREAQADRSGLLHDTSRRTAPASLTIVTPELASERREGRPKKGSYEAFKRLAQCPCCGASGVAGGVAGAHVAGVWAAGNEAQTLTHMLFQCQPALQQGFGAEVVRLRAEATDWLDGQGEKLLGSHDSKLALRALRGEWSVMDPGEQTRALRFVLGHPDAPPDCDNRRLALTLARRFYRHVADLLRAARAASLEAQRSPPTLKLLWRVRPRSEWMAKRGLRDVWQGWRTSVCCFRAWRLRVALRGPANSNLRMRSPQGRCDSPLFASAQGTVAMAWALASAFAVWGSQYADGPKSRAAHGPGRGDQMREHCVSTAMHARASLVRLRRGGRAQWADAKDDSRPRSRQVGRKASRNTVPTAEAAALTLAKRVKDWERVNVKDARKFWKGSTAATKAGSAPGSEVEQRQAKAQRTHAEACQRETDFELARVPAVDHGANGSHGISAQQLLYLARRLRCAEPFTAEYVDNIGEPEEEWSDVEIAAFVIHKEWAAELALSDPAITSCRWLRRAMHVSRGWALEAEEAEAEARRPGAAECDVEMAEHQAPDPAPFAVRRAILQRLAVWLRSAEPFEADELEAYREFFHGRDEMSDDCLANRLMHPRLADRFAVTDPNDAPSPLVGRVMRIARELAEAARGDEAEHPDCGLEPSLSEVPLPDDSSEAAIIQPQQAGLGTDSEGACEDAAPCEAADTLQQPVDEKRPQTVEFEGGESALSAWQQQQAFQNAEDELLKEKSSWKWKCPDEEGCESTLQCYILREARSARFCLLCRRGIEPREIRYTCPECIMTSVCTECAPKRLRPAGAMRPVQPPSRRVAVPGGAGCEPEEGESPAGEARCSCPPHPLQAADSGPVAASDLAPEGDRSCPHPVEPSGDHEADSAESHAERMRLSRLPLTPPAGVSTSAPSSGSNVGSETLEPPRAVQGCGAGVATAGPPAGEADRSYPPQAPQADGPKPAPQGGPGAEGERSYPPRAPLAESLGCSREGRSEVAEDLSQPPHVQKPQKLLIGERGRGGQEAPAWISARPAITPRASKVPRRQTAPPPAAGTHAGAQEPVQADSAAVGQGASGLRAATKESRPSWASVLSNPPLSPSSIQPCPPRGSAEDEAGVTRSRDQRLPSSAGAAGESAGAVLLKACAEGKAAKGRSSMGKVAGAKQDWRPPGSGMRSSTLGSKRLGTPQVQRDGAIGSKKAVQLGKGIKVKGSSAQSMKRGGRLQAMASGSGRADGGEAQRAARAEAELAPQPPSVKRKRGEQAEEVGSVAKRGRLREAGLAGIRPLLGSGSALAIIASRSKRGETL